MKNKVKIFLVISLLFVFVSQITLVNGLNAEEMLSDKSFPNAAVTFIQWPSHEGDDTTPIKITKDTSQVLRFDRPIVRIAISNPGICDITTIGDKDVLVNSKQAGSANLLVWDEADTIATYQLSSIPNVEKLWHLLQNVDPNGNFNVVPFNDTVAVYGSVSTSEKLKQVQDASKAFDAHSLCYAQLKESKQVMLECRFAEVNRNANKDFKFDLQALTANNFIGDFLTGQTGIGSNAGGTRNTNNIADIAVFDQITSGVGNLGGIYTGGAGTVAYAIKWLESKNILKIIARPNLMAKDGEEAHFVVGGELPISTSVASGGTTTTSVTYKEYGTKLTFTPTVLNDDMIRLKTDTEVSEIDSSNVFTVGGGTVPSFIKRSNQTVAELRDNESLVIGGIITQRITKVNRKTPVLSNIPIFGIIFKADEFQRQDVELLIVITPHVIKPMSLNESKIYYEPSQVKEATRIYKPTYVDSHADVINGMITENETPRDVNEDDAKEFSKLVAKRMEKRSGKNSVKSGLASPPLKSPQAKKIPPAILNPEGLPK